MNKYAIYTEKDVYPVLEKDGEYYIGAPNTGHFSGQWKFLGVVERLKNSRNIIKPEDALKITDWKFKNGSPKYQVVDLDHGTVRRWASPRQVISFGPISDNMFKVATKTDKDEEIVLEESKKYAIYATYGGDGVYNSKLVDTVDSEEQAVDRVAELQATGVGASYEEVETKNEDDKISDTQADTVNKLILKKGYQYILGNKDSFIDKIDYYYPDRDNIINKIYNFLGDSENLVTVNLEDIDNIKETKSYQSSIYQYDNYVIDLMYYNSIPVAVGCDIDEEGYYDKNESYIVLLNKDNIEIPLEEECSQASGVASGTNGKIDSFPINPKEMEKQRLKEDINNPYFVIEDIGAAYLMAGPFKTKVEAERKKKEQIKEYNLEEEAEIIYVWDWNTIKEFEDNAYDTYQEFINAGDSAPYYKEEKLEESKRLSEGKKIDISNFEDVNYCVAGTKDMLYSDDVSNVTFVSTEEEAKEQIKAYEQQGLKYSAYKDITDIKNIILNIVNRFKNNSNLKFEVDTTVFIRYSDNKIIIGMINYSLDISKTDINKYNYVDICLHDYTPAEYNKYSGHTEYFVFSDNKKLKSIPNKNINSVKDAEEEMINYIRQWLGTDYTEEDDDNDILFDTLNNLIDYLNDNTNYEWDANEIYDNCAITESEDLGSYDYIEVFCWLDSKTQKVHYTINSKGNDTGTQYNSLEDVIKNLPLLDRDIKEDLNESKDLTQTLQEMALLEDYEEDKTISPQKQKFIDYCKDKIEDLGDIEIYDEDYEENVQYHKIMHTEGIREFNDLYIIANFDDYENENLIAINNENKIVINTPMIDCNGYAATMQFDKIDKQFYDQLMDYWDDIYMDEIIEEE